MTSFPRQCRRTIRPQWKNKSIIICQPGSEAAARACLKNHFCHLHAHADSFDSGRNVRAVASCLIDYPVYKREEAINYAGYDKNPSFGSLKRYHHDLGGRPADAARLLLTIIPPPDLDGTVWTFSHFAEQVMKEISPTRSFPPCASALITDILI